MMPVLVTIVLVGLGGDGFSVREEGERALVAATGFRDAVKARYGLNVVVQDLRPRSNNKPQRGIIALEVRREHFDAAARCLLPDFFDN